MNQSPYSFADNYPRKAQPKLGPTTPKIEDSTLPELEAKDKISSSAETLLSIGIFAITIASLLALILSFLL